MPDFSRNKREAKLCRVSARKIELLQMMIVIQFYTIDPFVFAFVNK